MNKLLFTFFAILAFLCYSTANAQIKILFDATKSETSGSADWVLDADGSKYGVLQLPTPDQSTITSTTTDTYWSGALSSWGIDCVKKGFHVESLPSSGKITYGVKTNAQDLSNYKVYVVCEPNVLFTATEKTALLNFVKNGGGLFIISDHAGSDRNNDGNDSPTVWDDFFNNNGSVSNPFGISFSTTNPNLKLYPSDITEVSTNLSKITNPITKGTFGTVTKISFSRGTTMTLDTIANNTVKGLVFSAKSANILDGAMIAYARYGKGKIVAIGDSSPSDDGTGFTNTGLFQSYSGDTKVGDNHRYFFMNATIWLATTDTILPINFENISCKNSENITTIQWQTSEQYAQHPSYQVEHSVNGTDFIALANVNTAKSISNRVSNYEYSTKEELETTVYYRIKSTENGVPSYSKVFSLNPSHSDHPIKIYPNPLSASKNSNFNISGLLKGSIVTITNMNGVKYLESKSNTSSISFNTNNFNGQKLSQGIYSITVRELNGNTNTSKLLVGK